MPVSGKAANHPVQTVDWYDCVKWCNARSQQAGLTPVYYTDAGLTQVYTNGETTNVYVELDGQRLSVADGSGVGEGGAGRVERATVSVGQRHLGKPGQLLWRHQRLQLRFGTERLQRRFRKSGVSFPTRVRWDLLRRTGMDYTTWRGMSLSGVGIGMGRRMDNQQPRIQPDRHLEPIVCCAAAIGTSTPTSRGAPIASTSTRTLPATTLGFVV